MSKIYRETNYGTIRDYDNNMSSYIGRGTYDRTNDFKQALAAEINTVFHMLGLYTSTHLNGEPVVYKKYDYVLIVKDIMNKDAFEATMEFKKLLETIAFGLNEDINSYCSTSEYRSEEPYSNIRKCSRGIDECLESINNFKIFDIRLLPDYTCSSYEENKELYIQCMIQKFLTVMNIYKNL